jgi:flagellar biosynthesis/type III secretory pathway protein FliH
MSRLCLKLAKPVYAITRDEERITSPVGQDDVFTEEFKELAKKNELKRQELLLRSQELAQKQIQTRILQEIDFLLTRINDSMTNFAIEFDEFVKSFEKKLVSMSMAAAKKIIAQELQTNPTLVTNTINRALTFVNEKKNIVIELNPADKKLLEQNKAVAALIEAKNMKWDLAENADISQGGCVIRSQLGTVDASVENQLKLIETFLEENLHDE